MASLIEAIFFDLGDTLIKRSATKSWLDRAKELVRSLRSQGFRLGIISNTGTLDSRSAILDILPDDFDIDLFEPELVLFSSEAHVEKPSPIIFARAVQLAAVPAAKCLYVSEDILESLVAQFAGMRSLRIRTGSDDLRNLDATIRSYDAAIG